MFIRETFEPINYCCCIALLINFCFASTFEIMSFRYFLLIRPTLLLEGLINLHLVLCLKFSLWSFNVIYSCWLEQHSILFTILRVFAKLFVFLSISCFAFLGAFLYVCMFHTCLPDLCLTEKYMVARANYKDLLNKRTELISKCRHKNKYILKNIK